MTMSGEMDVACTMAPTNIATPINQKPRFIAIVHEIFILMRAFKVGKHRHTGGTQGTERRRGGCEGRTLSCRAGRGSQ